MPYQSNQDLPESVRNHLPDHAQSIYRKVFNSSFERYGDEGRAAAAAWAVVERMYEKDKHGKWVEKS